MGSPPAREGAIVRLNLGEKTQMTDKETLVAQLMRLGYSQPEAEAIVARNEIATQLVNQMGMPLERALAVANSIVGSVGPEAAAAIAGIGESHAQAGRDEASLGTAPVSPVTTGMAPAPDVANNAIGRGLGPGAPTHPGLSPAPTANPAVEAAIKADNDALAATALSPGLAPQVGIHDASLGLIGLTDALDAAVAASRGGPPTSGPATVVSQGFESLGLTPSGIIGQGFAALGSPLGFNASPDAPQSLAAQAAAAAQRGGHAPTASFPDAPVPTAPENAPTMALTGVPDAQTAARGGFAVSPSALADVTGLASPLGGPIGSSGFNALANGLTPGEIAAINANPATTLGALNAMAAMEGKAAALSPAWPNRPPSTPR
jgi:hypothetical protein